MLPPKVTNPVRMTWKNYQMQIQKIITMFKKQNSKDFNYVQTTQRRYKNISEE